MKRRLMIALGAGILVVLLSVLAKGLWGVMQGESDLGAPPTSRLMPVPEGTAVLVNETSRGEGSLGADQRVVVLDTSKAAAPVAQVTASYLEGLRNRGWTLTDATAALSPDASICLTAVPMADYLADDERPEATKRLLRELGRAPDSVGVITAVFC